MKVNKEILYHANSGEVLKVGDTLIFDSNTHNRMYEEVYNNEFKLNELDANELSKKIWNGKFEWVRL